MASKKHCAQQRYPQQFEKGEMAIKERDYKFYKDEKGS